MAVKIRLARKGRKRLAFYHIVVADSRSPRDGRYIEKIGSYNPVTNPATIELDFDKALGWLQNGAIPTDTCRAILSYKGVLIKKHLLDGVRKGAFDDAEATRRFEEWMKLNEEKVEAKKLGLEKSQDDELKKRLSAEKKINDDRLAKFAKRNADLAAKLVAEVNAVAAGDEDGPEEETSEEPVSAEESTQTEEVLSSEEPAPDKPAEETVADKVVPVEEPTPDKPAEETAADEVVEDKPQ